MNSRFKQASRPTTLDTQLGWHTFAQSVRRREQARITAMFAGGHVVDLCSPERPCGGIGCPNTKAAQERQKTAAN